MEGSDVQTNVTKGVSVTYGTERNNKYNTRNTTVVFLLEVFDTHFRPRQYSSLGGQYALEGVQRHHLVVVPLNAGYNHHMVMGCRGFAVAENSRTAVEECE